MSVKATRCGVAAARDQRPKLCLGGAAMVAMGLANVVGWGRAGRGSGLLMPEEGMQRLSKLLVR